MSEVPGPEGKERVLMEHGVLNPKPEDVRDKRFEKEGFFDPRDLVQVKYEMVGRVRSGGATVTEAVDAFGFSRPTFYHAQRALEQEGLLGLLPKRPGPKGARKLTEEVMVFIEGLVEEGPDVNSEELTRRVWERFGLSVHRRSIERALVRREKKRRRSS